MLIYVSLRKDIQNKNFIQQKTGGFMQRVQSNKSKLILYFFVVSMLVVGFVFWIRWADKKLAEERKVLELFNIVNNDIQKYDALFPDFLIPHIIPRDEEDKDPFEPKRRSDETIEDFERRKENHEQIRNIV